LCSLCGKLASLVGERDMTIVNKEKSDREGTTCCVSVFVDVPSCILFQIYGRPKESSSWAKISASKSVCPHVKVSALLQCCFIVVRSDVVCASGVPVLFQYYFIMINEEVCAVLWPSGFCYVFCARKM
jgi:hypothetical protein